MIPITVLIGSGFIDGLMISRSEWEELWFEELGTGDAGFANEVRRAFEDPDVVPDDALRPEPCIIYMRQAKHSGAFEKTFGLWRGRAAAISGWTNEIS